MRLSAQFSTRLNGVAHRFLFHLAYVLRMRIFGRFNRHVRNALVRLELYNLRRSALMAQLIQPDISNKDVVFKWRKLCDRNRGPNAAERRGNCASLMPR